MAILERIGGGARCMLLARHIVGRSRAAALRLSAPAVSGEHATLRWNGQAWEVHDLGSRNGTTVDGRPLAPGERVVLARGAILTFGHPHERWQLVDDGPPAAVAVPEHGGEPRHAEGELLALPSDEAPELVIYRDRSGEWIREEGGMTERVGDGQTLVAGGQRYLLHLPEIVNSTADGNTGALSIEHLRLCFAVSRDEEYVTLTAHGQGQSIDLGGRAHHFLLLTLARARLDDEPPSGAEPAGEALPESARGWIYQEDLARMLGLDEPHLNVTIFRCRRHLAAAGIRGAASVIERRRPTKQLRLGVRSVEILRR